jgi:hypothetical protein
VYRVAEIVMYRLISKLCYKLSFGKSEWQSCALTNGEGDCTIAHDVCSNPIMGIGHAFDHGQYVQEMVNLGRVSNMTACIHGYVHAWNHLCTTKGAEKEDLTCPLPEDGHVVQKS